VCLLVTDVLEVGGGELLARPYRERRAILEGPVPHGVLAAPFTLYPATRDRAAALGRLDPTWQQRASKASWHKVLVLSE
jgi:ATP-dependent DNA ligase